jgi:hypothetical protein
MDRSWDRMAGVVALQSLACAQLEAVCGLHSGPPGQDRWFDRHPVRINLI